MVGVAVVGGAEVLTELDGAEVAGALVVPGAVEAVVPDGAVEPDGAFTVSVDVDSGASSTETVGTSVDETLVVVVRLGASVVVDSTDVEDKITWPKSEDESSPEQATPTVSTAVNGNVIRRCLRRIRQP